MTRTWPLYYPTWLMDPAPPLECCERVARAGFDGASFLVGPRDDPRRLDLLEKAHARSLRDFFQREHFGRSLHVATDMYLALTEDDAEAAALLKAQSERAAVACSDDRLAPPVLTLDPPVRHRGGQDLWRSDMARLLIEWLADLAENEEIRTGIENWPYPFIGTPKAVREALVEARGRVGVLLDLGHANLVLARGWWEGDMASLVAAMPRPILEVHLHDNHGEADEHLPPGEGTTDLAGALEALHSGGFEGPVTVECNLMGSGDEGLAAGCRAVRERFRDYFGREMRSQ